MSDVIFITNAKGGAGSTTCAAMTALSLAIRGERTLFVDGDTRSGNGLFVAGVNELCTYTLEDAFKGACRIKQALINHPLSPNLYILPTLDCRNGDFIADAVTSLCQTFDVILCDNAAARACNRAALVTEPYPASIKSAKRAAAQLKDTGFKAVELIVNKVNGGLVFDGAILTPQELASITRCELLGVVPEDLLLPMQKIKKDTRKAFDTIAQKLLGGDKIYDVIKAYYGVKGKVKRKMRCCI